MLDLNPLSRINLDSALRHPFFEEHIILNQTIENELNHHDELHMKRPRISSFQVNHRIIDQKPNQIPVLSRTRIEY